MDYVVKSWILGTLADDLAEVISSQSSTTRDAWLAVESQFLGNREARAIQLETKFRNFVQGDLSISEYCRCLKMADDLGACDEVITYRTLVLNVIRGLNDNFAHVGPSFGAVGRSPPSWRPVTTSSLRDHPGEQAALTNHCPRRLHQDLGPSSVGRSRFRGRWLRLRGR